MTTQQSISAVPVLDTAAYASGDCLHTAPIHFTILGSGAFSGFVEKMVVVDGAVQSAALELWLFDTSPTPAAANAAHSISDADAAHCIGVIYSGAYAASALNSVSVAKGLNLAVSAAGREIYGILVSRGTGTYGVSDLVVTLEITAN